MKHRILLTILALALSACSPAQQQTTQKQANDALIVAQARAQLTAIDAATVGNVHISVNNGTLTLWGVVADRTERDTIDSSVKGIGGVHRVIDRISINPKAPNAGQVTSDFELQTRVEAALAAQTGVNALHVGVKAERGVVTVSGSVPTRALHQTAMDAVRSVSGIKRIVDRIRVQGS